MQYIIKKCNNLKGSVNIPGDKSISHRTLLLGAIAEGKTVIKNLSRCQDVRSTQYCLEKLGVSFTEEKQTMTINGKGLYGLREPDSPLDAGNSGTTVRLLSGILAAQPFHSVITGDQFLSKRPMDRIILPLRKMGAEIKAKEDRYLPLDIRGKSLAPLHYHTPIASAQVKSCVLLAGLYTNGEVSVSEPFTSRDHTEKMLSGFGIDIKKHNTTITIQGNKQLKPTEINVPADISSVAFFIAAALLADNSELQLKNIGINPTRTGILTALKKMGAEIYCNNPRYFNNEPVADLHINSQSLTGTIIKDPLIPHIIDEIPILAVTATQATGKTKIIDAEELRVKETDRIHALYVNLNAMGADVTELKDGLVIQGPTPLKGAEINTFGDHRIAMAFSVAGSIAEGNTIINDSECTDVSFPGFFKILESVYA